MQFIDLKQQYQLLKPTIDAAIQRVLDHGNYIMGPEIPALEAALAEYVGVKHCITVASGTDSLEIALRAWDIGPGDEVITVPFTWISSAEAIALVGAKPVFVDIDRVFSKTQRRASAPPSEGRKAVPLAQSAAQVFFPPNPLDVTAMGEPFLRTMTTWLKKCAPFALTAGLNDTITPWLA